MTAVGALDRTVLAFKALVWSNDKPKLSHRYPVSKQKRERNWDVSLNVCSQAGLMVRESLILQEG